MIGNFFAENWHFGKLGFDLLHVVVKIDTVMVRHLQEGHPSQQFFLVFLLYSTKIDIVRNASFFQNIFFNENVSSASNINFG